MCILSNHSDIHSWLPIKKNKSWHTDFLLHTLQGLVKGSFSQNAQAEKLLLTPPPIHSTCPHHIWAWATPKCPPKPPGPGQLSAEMISQKARRWCPRPRALRRGWATQTGALPPSRTAAVSAFPLSLPPPSGLLSIHHPLLPANPS